MARDGAAAVAASGSRRQNHAPTAATTAASTNTECAPQRAAIGSATAGPSALMDSAAAPNRPIACASFALGATSATRVIPAAKKNDHAMPCTPRSSAAAQPALWMKRNPSAEPASSRLPSTIARRQPSRFITGAMTGIATRLATPNAAITTPIWRAVAW